MTLDYSKSSHDLIIDLINVRSRYPIKAEDITLQPPEEYFDEEYEANTKLTFVSTGVNPKMPDADDLYYNRIDIGIMFAGVAEDAAIERSDDLTGEEILSILNKRFQLGLLPSDFKLDEMDISQYGIFIPTADDGLVYTGMLSLPLKDPEPTT